MAGNITKRHSATRLQFARYGGTCPLGNVHEAVAAPGRILVQIVETPDGVRYVSMAMGLVKESGSYSEPDRRFAVALGCEASFASQFVYADGMQVDSAPATPIASSRSEEHTSETPVTNAHLVCRLLLAKKKS